MPKPKQHDEKLIKSLAEIQCTMIEIASICECSVDTLERRYADIIKAAREGGKASLRRMQYKKALEGNTSMLIWLGKHYLGQKESLELSATSEPEVRKLLNYWESGKVASLRPDKSKKQDEEAEESKTA